MGSNPMDSQVEFSTRFDAIFDDADLLLIKKSDMTTQNVDNEMIPVNNKSN